VLSESNGWLHLSANGFQFSNPSIQVKLSQDAPAPVATPTPAPIVAPVTPAKTTITCIKGKISKLITAVKPVCPMGYQKK